MGGLLGGGGGGGGGGEGYVDPPLKLLGGGVCWPPSQIIWGGPGPPSSYAYVMQPKDVSRMAKV